MLLFLSLDRRLKYLDRRNNNLIMYLIDTDRRRIVKDGPIITKSCIICQRLLSADRK